MLVLLRQRFRDTSETRKLISQNPQKVSILTTYITAVHVHNDNIKAPL